ncbi:MAG: ATP-binding protein, partial [Phycisphaerae bacterium]|nr:ATP-binding protein [Phycisphaerae bacterium]
MTLLVANDLAALPVLQAASTALVRAVDDSSSDAREIELVIEELFTNILKYEYLPGQRESIRVSFEVKDQVFDLRIRFKGVPFDVDDLRRCRYCAPSDLVGDEGRGLGLELIRYFSDQLQYRNLGKEGQEIHLCRKLSICRDRVQPVLVDANVPESSSAGLVVIVRRMLPEEAAAVSKLAY